LVVVISVKTCRQNPGLDKIGQNCRALGMKIWVGFIVAGDVEPP
jgi:hypothetical protein